MYWIDPIDAESVFIPFPNEKAYDDACDWYNGFRTGGTSNLTKRDIISYCEAEGISLDDPTSENRLISCWADIAMAVYAWQEVDPKMLPLVHLLSRHVRYL